MVNATAITVHNLVQNSYVEVTPDTLDTGTSPVTLAAVCTSATDRVLLEVTNNATVTLTVAVLGDNTLPSYKGTPASVTKSSIAAGATWAFGPFSPSRYNRNGTLTVTFTPDPAGAITASLRCTRMPAKVSR